MALKDLFGKKSIKPLSPKNVEQIKEEIESADLLKNKSSIDGRFIPRVDFSNPKNFAFYGSAQKYYEQSLLNIHGYYPFDGSRSEKLLWEMSSSYLDMHVFENRYPKSVGHARVGQSYASTGASSNGYYNTSNQNTYLSMGDQTLDRCRFPPPQFMIVSQRRMLMILTIVKKVIFPSQAPVEQPWSFG